MAPTDEELKKIFETYDKDGSGKIDIDELGAALAQLGRVEGHAFHHENTNAGVSAAAP